MSLGGTCAENRLIEANASCDDIYSKYLQSSNDLNYGGGLQEPLPLKPNPDIAGFAVMPTGISDGRISTHVG